MFILKATRTGSRIAIGFEPIPREARGTSLLPQNPMTLTNHIKEPTNNSKTASDATFVTSLSRLQSAADMPPSVSAAQTLTCRPPTVLGSALGKREPSAFDEPTCAWILAQLISFPKFGGRARKTM
jgi:hypothetical protein